MEFLKELFSISAQLVVESKKLVVPTSKPVGGKAVNDVLRTRKGGRMKAATDYDRNKVKRETNRALTDSLDVDKQGAQ